MVHVVFQVNNATERVMPKKPAPQAFAANGNQLFDRVIKEKRSLLAFSA